MTNAPVGYGPPLPLHERAGIEVTLNPAALSLTFGANVNATPGEQRNATDLGNVLMRPETARPDDVLYTVYRSVAPREAADVIAARGLVYVALVMRPGTIGREFARARGHLNNAARGAAFPEVHEIWHGRALLYLQKRAASDPEDVCVIPLAAGDKAVVAPGWASLLVNIGTDPLVVGTWRTQDCIPQHTDLEACGGMAHYVLSESGGGYSFAPNRAGYPNPPAPRVLAPRDLADFGLKSDQPMLTTFRRNPDFLRFLLRPQDYERVWATLYRDAEGAASA